MNRAELIKTAAQGESERLEFKKSTGQRTEAAKTVCGMLNGRGGMVLIGVTDKGELLGQEVSDKTQRDLARELSRIEPPPMIDLVSGKMIREDSPAYPPLATREALANALCHRNYATAGETVGIAIFDDHLEIISPGGLHFGLTLEDLTKEHASLPWNPNIANVLFRAGIIEQWGTGTTKIGQYCSDNGNPQPTWQERTGSLVIAFKPIPEPIKSTSTPQITPQVEGLLVDLINALATGEKGREELQKELGLSDRKNFKKNYLTPALENGLVARTIPDKPNSRLQKYRLTSKGRTVARTIVPQM